MSLTSHGTRLLGRYLLCDQIGSGGMATIHLARLLGPQGFSRTVAIKQLHPQFAQNPEFVAMFLDEARLAVRVRHGNVISPLDIVVANGSELFIVMDYVNGESLASLLRAAGGPLHPPIASAILVQVLLGLHAAHEATREQGEALGLVHRDVSPQNILVGQDGVARVLDFGIAKAAARAQTTEEGKLKGKIGYMAPEQLRLEAIDRRADLFTAGIVLWEALTGTGLFVADALGASIELILRGVIAPPSTLNPAVTPALDAIVCKALAREPSERFQDAMSMAAALQQATAPASALEVIDWVEALVGPELARKAELVRRAESRDWEEVPVPSPAPPLADELAAQERAEFVPATTTVPLAVFFPAPARAVDVGAVDARVSANGAETTLRMVEEFAARTARMSTSPLPSVETTGVAVGADRQPPTHAGEGRQRKLLGWMLGASLAGAAAALAVLSPPGAERSAAIPAKEALNIHGASTERLASVLSHPASGTRSVPASITSALPAHEPSALPSAMTPGGSAALASAVRPRLAAVSASSPVQARPVKVAPARRTVGARDKKAARAKSENCDPPWTVNDQQIKLFKEECLR